MEEWTLRTKNGSYLAIDEQRQLVLSNKPTKFTVLFLDDQKGLIKILGRGPIKVSAMKLLTLTVK